MRPWKSARRPTQPRRKRSLALELDSLEDRLLLSFTPMGYSPSQIRTAYGVNQIEFGGIKGDGTGQTIAIVDAGNDPYIESDLTYFDSYYDIQNPPNFTVYNETGTVINPATTLVPATDTSDSEEDMDVEWAHAIAPGASIDVIECNVDTGGTVLGNEFAGIVDLIHGARTAAGLSGVSVVSMSWAMAESQLIPLIQALGLNESVLDSSFTTPKGHNGVTFLAASGGYGIYGDYTINNDLTPTVEYPAASPNVVAVGGTTLRLNTQGVYPGTGSDGEIGWSTGSDTNSGFSPYAASGGGISEYESQPSYQENVPGTSSSGRTIPDVSFDADPNTGVAVCDLLADAQSDLGPWSNTIGNGTSLATPCWAGLIAIADQGRVAEGGTTLDGPSQTLPALYSLPSSDFHDITIGYNGYPPNGYSAGPGYDLVTGRGTPVANLLVPDLASYGMATHLVVTTQPPSSVIAGVGFHFTITAEDPYGNVATGFGGSVIATVTGASSGVTVTAVNGGAAYYVDVTTAGTYTFTATSSGLTSTTTTAFTVTPAAASQLVVTTQPPSSITAGSGFGLTIEAEDPYGNVATSFTGSVTIALGSNPGGSTLSGPTTVAASGGVAVFSGLSLNNLGVGYILQASGGGLTPVATTSFTVQAPPPQVQGATVLTYQKKNSKGKPIGKPVLTGYQFTFNTAMNPATTGYSANYLVQTYVQVRVKVGKRFVKELELQPISFTVNYLSSSYAVQLLTGKQAFKYGGKITLIGTGISSAAGALLGNNVVYNISAGGHSISLA